MPVCFPSRSEGEKTWFSGAPLEQPHRERSATAMSNIEMIFFIYTTPDKWKIISISIIFYMKLYFKSTVILKKSVNNFLNFNLNVS